MITYFLALFCFSFCIFLCQLNFFAVGILSQKNLEANNTMK